MTVKEFVSMVRWFVGKNDPQIEIFTDVSRPADIISIEYCKENNVIMLNMETKDNKDE